MGGVTAVDEGFEGLESDGIILTRRVTSREGDADVARGAREAREGCASAFRVFPSEGSACRAAGRSGFFYIIAPMTDEACD